MTKPKRKVDINTEAKEPMNKVAKTEEYNPQMKQNISLHNMKKPDLLQHCKSLEEIILKLTNENNILIKEKVDNVDAINRLQESVKVLELRNKRLQEEENFKYTCGECDYMSDCVHCFSDHDHDQEDADDQEIQDSNFSCYYCDEIFPTKPLVMRHTKIAHIDKANHCLNFLQGTCSYDNRCWFLHDETLKESDPTITCNYCTENFRTKTQLMHHKKHHHIDKVSKCNNEKTNCKYGYEKCWFLHTEDIKLAYESAKNVNKNVNGTNIKNDTGHKDMNKDDQNFE